MRTISSTADIKQNNLRLIKMSYASYYQQQDLVLRNISLVFHNVTFPSQTAWNTLKSNSYTVDGRFMRFYTSSGSPTNLWLFSQTIVDASSTGGTSDSQISGIWIFLAIIVLIAWPALGIFAVALFTSYGNSFLFWFYDKYGLVGKKLNLAVRYGHLHIVKACLNRGIDVNCTDNKYYMEDLLGLLFAFLCYGPFVIVFFYFCGCGDYNDLVSSSAGKGYTPLMWAVRRGHLPVVTYLIEQNANVKLKNVSIVIVSL